jgi:hypothetical protein
MSQFLWSGVGKKQKFHLVNWEHLSLPTKEGGWGLRNLHLVGVALALKSLWRGLLGSGLWHVVLTRKYFKHVIVEEWIRRGNFHNSGSLFWKAMVEAIPFLLDCLTWEVGKGAYV